MMGLKDAQYMERLESGIKGYSTGCSSTMFLGIDWGSNSQDIPDLFASYFQGLFVNDLGGECR
jgi:hypothetical protein